MKLRTQDGLAAGLALLWLFVRGVTLDARVIASELLLGAVLGATVAYIFRRLYPDTVDIGRLARATPYALLYLAAFLWELLTANIDVAKRVLAPSMPLEPRVIELPLRVQTPLAITTIANSITLTPGTLTMDYDDEANLLYVHAIAGTDPSAVADPIRRWEDYALVIFDEKRKPGDPVPAPVTAANPRDADGDDDVGDVDTVDDGDVDDVDTADVDTADGDADNGDVDVADTADDQGGVTDGE